MAFLADRNGATAVEYAILIGMIAIFVGAIAGVASVVGGIFDDLPSHFE